MDQDGHVECAGTSTSPACLGLEQERHQYHCEGQTKPEPTEVDDGPFVPECEVFFEGGPDSRQLLEGCRKNPGHPTFIPVSEFTEKSLPKDCQTAEIVDYIKHTCDRTVKITVDYCSPGRPGSYPNTTAPYPYHAFRGNKRVVRCGTGFVENTLPSVTRGKCPCHLCTRAEVPEMTYLVVQISTAAHVIFDGAEARNVVCEMFYDSDDLDGVKCLYGLKEWDFTEYCECDACCNADNNDNNDADSVNKQRVEKCTYDSNIIMCVTHDSELIKRLLTMCSVTKATTFPLELIVSHPHGGSKHISFGKTLKHILPRPVVHSADEQFTIGCGSKCRLTRDALTASVELFEQFSKHLGNSSMKRADDGDPLTSNRGDDINTLTISDTMEASLPPDASYIYQIERVKEGGCSNYTKWIRFPYGTKFTIGNADGRENNTFFLPDVEFQLEDLDGDADSQSWGPFYVTYDIDTCPGCSGAPIMIMDEDGPYFKCHSGALRDGTNRSEVS